MKKYTNYSRKFYINAVYYFYGCSTKKEAEKTLIKLTAADIDNIDTLIIEFNNNEFIKNL